MTPEQELSALRQQVARLTVELAKAPPDVTELKGHARKWETRAKRNFAELATARNEAATYRIRARTYKAENDRLQTIIDKLLQAADQKAEQ